MATSIGGGHLQSKEQLWIGALAAILEEPFASTLKLETPPRHLWGRPWMQIGQKSVAESPRNRLWGILWIQPRSQELWDASLATPGWLMHKFIVEKTSSPRCIIWIEQPGHNTHMYIFGICCCISIFFFTISVFFMYCLQMTLPALRPSLSLSYSACRVGGMANFILMFIVVLLSLRSKWTTCGRLVHHTCR